MHSICFIAGGDMTWASSRMRCYWPAMFLEQAAVVTWRDIQAGGLPDAQAYVFQKLVDMPLVRSLSGKAWRFWDVCDPVWWFNPAESREIATEMDGFVASSAALAEDFTRWCGFKAHVIPDRILPEHFDRQREHEDVRPVRLIWFGSVQNRIALHAAAANLARLRANGHEVTLTIYDNGPNISMPEMEEMVPVYYSQWALEREAETLAGHDIALLPPYPGPWGVVKSNNRTLTAFACGLPVSSGLEYERLRNLVCDEQTRREWARAGLQVAEQWHVRQSAAEWQALLNEYEQ